MTDTLPRVIEFEDVKAGDTIRAECTDRGMHVTRQGVVGNVHSLLAATLPGGVLTYGNGDIITLLDRPVPRMDEPTRLGSVVVAKVGGGAPELLVRTCAKPRGWWHLSFGLTIWDDLIDPRPATPEERRTGRVIEP